MKKLFTFALALVAFMGVAKAATVDDLEVLKHSYVLVCDELGARPGSGVLFGANHFLDLKGGTTATNKGSVDLSVAGGNEGYVTEEIAAKYGEDYAGPHYNWLRLKNQQDMIALKLTAKSKIIIFEQGNNKTGKDARIPRISTDPEQSNSLNPAPGEDHPATVSGYRWEFTVDDDGLYYLGSYNGDMFVSFIIIEANEAPGTPTVKVGDQTYEGGLWFREVSCKANDMVEEGGAEPVPTVVTYTTDGSAPTAASPLYTAPIKCYANQTVKFQAFMDFGDHQPNDDLICDGADNEANVNFVFDAPTINAEGGHVTITSPYEGARNYVTLDGNLNSAEEQSDFTLEESATVTAFSKIFNGTYATFETKSVSKDVYVLNPIKEKKLITVSGNAVVDAEATAADQNGNTIYMIENGAITADKKDFFVKNLTFKALANADEANAKYQVPAGQEAYIQMSNTNITFQVAEGDSVNVHVICSKNACKNIDAADAEDGSQVNDRKCYVNVSGTNYCLKDAEGNETNDLKLYPEANEFTFGLPAGTYTFQKYSGTGNILISSIEITPVAAAPAETETVLWEGEALVNAWADQPMFLSDGGTELAANNAKAGDRLRIYASAPDDNWQVELWNGHWDGQVERFSAKDLGTNEDGTPRTSLIFDLAALGYFEYTLTDTFLATNVGTAQGWGGTFLLNGDGNLTVTKISLVQGGASSIQNIQTINRQSNVIYNLAGQKVDANYRGVVIVNGKKMLQK